MKCKICGKRFSIKRENVYMCTENLSMLEALSRPPKVYDIVDCPKCGCQNPLNIRMQMYTAVSMKEENNDDLS